jgi:pyruvate/2-oxoacid:ferredoxin oxidoreductase alpha subunit
LTRLLARASRVAVLDRDISPGMGGVLWSESRGCARRDAIVQGYMLGLGGGDIRPVHVADLIEDVMLRHRSGEPELAEVA